jgi:hypothetical protein
MPALTNANYLFYTSGTKTLQLPSSLPVLSTADFLGYSMPNLEGEVILPNMPSLTSIGSAFNTCLNVTRIAFTGVHDLLWSFMSFAANCPKLIEIQLPTSMNGFNCTVNNSANSFVLNCPSLKKIIMPLSMNYTAFTGIGTGLFANLDNNINLEEITRCNTTWGSKPFSFMTNNCKKLKTFYHPEANIYSFVMNGFSAANRGTLESLELKWNSMFNAERTSAQIQLQYCNFETTELNRIFSALPDLTGTSYTGSMLISQNPGYAAANKAIATAKGWTVS